MRPFPLLALSALLALLPACGDPGTGQPADQDPMPEVEPDASPDPSPTPQPDAGTPDASPDPLPDPVPEPEGCAFSEPGEADRDRVVMLGMPFGAMIPEVGTEIRTLTLTTEGELVDEGARLDVGFRVARVAFVPSGALALVLGEGGELAAVQVDDALTLTKLGEVSLPSADYGDLVLADGGETAFVVGSNVAETSGISTVTLACDGTLTLVEEAFFNLRLAQSLALDEDKGRGVLFGGQAVFEPVDDHDLRLLAREGLGWREVGAFDVYSDFIGVDRIALSPDGGLLLAPNGLPLSDEAAQVAVVAVEGDSLREVQRMEGFPDVSEVRFTPDGQTALLTLGEPGQVVALRVDGLEVSVSQRVTGVGLASQSALIVRGALEGTLLLASVDPREGSNVAMLRVESPGTLLDLGQLQLGEGGPNIPGAIAVQP